MKPDLGWSIASFVRRAGCRSAAGSARAYHFPHTLTMSIRIEDSF